MPDKQKTEIIHVVIKSRASNGNTLQEVYEGNGEALEAFVALGELLEDIDNEKKK